MKGSGTCNVCAAPCSSCMHLSQETSYMESKAEGGVYSENSCARNEAENSFFSDAETPIPRKQRGNRVPSAGKASAGLPFRTSPFKTDEDRQLVADNGGDNISCLSTRTDRNIAADGVAKVEDVPCTSASALCNRNLETSSFEKDADGVNKIVGAPEEDLSDDKMRTDDDEDHHGCFELPKDGMCTKHEGTEENCITDSESSRRVSVQQSESKNGSPCTLSDSSGKHGLLKEKHRKKSPSPGKSDCDDSLIAMQQTTEEECSASENLEDDVKVCDICGDAGREDLLAICSRCSDGAEHIYCMRVMLKKLPEGDWLCEECSMKDTAASEMVKPEILVVSSKKPRQNEKNQKLKSSFSQNSLSEAEVVKKPAAKPELTPQLSIKLPTIGVKPVLSRDGSSKSLDSGKDKPVINSSLTSISQPSSEHIVCRPPGSTSVSSKSSGQQIQPSRGILARSSSISGLKSKVKPLIEDVTPKPQQVSKECVSGELKEEVLPGGSLSRSSSISGLKSKGKPLIEDVVLKPQQMSEGSALGESEEVMLAGLVSRSGSITGLKSKVKPLIENVILKTEHVSEESVVEELKEEVRLAGLLSRSSSMSGLKSKVKPLIENVILKPQHVTKESVVSELTEDVPRVLCKSLSLKNQSSRALNSSDSKTKSQSAAVHLMEEPRKQKQKERILERNNSLALNRSLSSSTSEQSISSSSNGSENVSDKGTKETKKQQSSKTPSNLIVTDGASQAVLKEDSKTEKIKECSTSGNFRPLAPPPRRIIRCQKCNETGHSTQFCSIDRIRVSALKPSAERNSREAPIKVNKWRDAVDVAMCKDKGQKSLVDRSMDTSQILTPTFVCLSKSEDSAVRQNKPIFESGEDQKQITSILDASRISALPEHEFIWQGNFELSKSGGLPEICEGFQAHLSSRASPKVAEVVTKFPDKVQLEEVNRLTSWPSQFQEKGPMEEHIALFFFAKDIKSYEINYKKLLETMQKNDLALKGNFDGVELLIFPSSSLPVKSQRWNRLFFLWGVFRERKQTLPKSAPSVGRKNPVLDLDLEKQPPIETSLDAEPTVVPVNVANGSNGSPILGAAPRNPSPPSALIQVESSNNLPQMEESGASLLGSIPSSSSVIQGQSRNSPPQTEEGGTASVRSIPGKTSPSGAVIQGQHRSSPPRTIKNEGDGACPEPILCNSPASSAVIQGQSRVSPPRTVKNEGGSAFLRFVSGNASPSSAVIQGQSRISPPPMVESTSVCLGFLPGNSSLPSAVVQAHGRNVPPRTEEGAAACLGSVPSNPSPPNAAAQGQSRNCPPWAEDGGAACLRSTLGDPSPPSVTSQATCRICPSRAEEGSSSCGPIQGRSNPWPPDLNLESQDVDEDGDEKPDDIWRWPPTSEKKRARSLSPPPWKPLLDGDGGERKRTRSPFWDTTTSKTEFGSGSSSQDDVSQRKPSERYFFPLGFSDVSASPSDELPELELGLGAETKRRAKREALPFSLEKTGPSENDEDDSASLSLSLAFPLSSNEQRQRTVGSSFFLFDRFRHG